MKRSSRSLLVPKVLCKEIDESDSLWNGPSAPLCDISIAVNIFF